MNIAIIISVSEYSDSQNNLPGCKKDSDAIYNIISKTKKFDDILYMHEKLSSAKIKERFTDFISKYRTEEIEELFFYFTGHGEFQNNEFYYILSDYNSIKRKQTSLQNEEVDNLFRTLNPNLVVKIIDACQSGKSYIKEAGAVDKYFQSTKNEFNKCYFLNSSLKDQSSFQSAVISDFTSSFIKSIKEHDTNEIRYKDIMDYISDEFDGNPSQTPFFVIQADYTEKFCIINPELKDYLVNEVFSVTPNTKVKQKEISLLDKVKKEAAEYLTKEQAIEVIERIRAKVNGFDLVENLKELYNLEIFFDETYDTIINEDIIGKWLDDNPNDFFAHSVFTRERKDRKTNPLSNLKSSFDIIKNDVEYEWVRAGFALDIEVPFKAIVISLLSKFPNLESLTTRIVFVLSKQTIRFFYFTTNYEEKSWDVMSLNHKISWSTSECQLHNVDVVEILVENIFNQLQEKVVKQLNERFPDDNSTSEKK